MNSLKIGISGVRGLVGETFTPELAVGFAQAFGTYLDSGRILVCRDARPSGPMVRSAVLAGLLASGCEAVDLGVCPTPSLQLAVRWLGADGGISITAGHNPEPWNALKFVRGDGLYLNALQAGEILSEEATLPLCAEIQLSRETGAVVTNVSTSAAVERVAERHGATVVRTPVGQAFISEAMAESRAVIGGEGSGGVIVPPVQLTHDSAAAVGLILEHVAQTGARVSELAATLPRLSMLKHYVEVEPNRIYSVLQRVYEELEREGMPFDETDGVKVQRPDGWVHVRVSNTESKIRVIAESDTAARAQELLDWARDLLGK